MEDRSHFGEQTTEIVDHERTYHAFSILLRWSMLVGVAVFVLGYMFLVRHEEKQPLNIWVEGR